HEYGDDGDYRVTVTVTDDDGAAGNATVTVAVTNRAPTVAIDMNGTVTLAEADAFLATAGEPRNHTATASDPGSDDLTFAWTPGPRETYYNDGDGPDPPDSPGGTYPFGRNDTAALNFTDPGVYKVSVTVTDDDGANATDSVTAVVTGDDEGLRGVAYWREAYDGDKPTEYSNATLRAFRNVTDVGSAVFGERVAVDSRAAVRGVLAANGTTRATARARALAAWFNFASGRVGWSEDVDTDGDGTGDRAFGDLIGEVGAILSDSEATTEELRRAKDLAGAANGRNATRSTETDAQTIATGQSGFGLVAAALALVIVAAAIAARRRGA
ncbi:MAG: hypothetical protein ABEH66_07095, partial [Halobacteriales archaeon]